MATIAFFPWLQLEAPLVVGDMRFLPYERGLLPGNLRNVTQADIDGVLGFYGNRMRRPLKKATLFEFGRWQSGQDLKKSLGGMWIAREVVAFSALSRRRLFYDSSRYVNSDSYRLYIQSFTEGNVSAVSFDTRRRSGHARTMASSSEPLFFRPDHVESHTRFHIDTTLALALNAEILKGESQILEAILEFNAANSDSDIPLRSEMVMMKCAFESLLNIGDAAKEFEMGVLELLSPFALRRAPQWRNLAFKKKFPKSTSPLAAWCREFCKTRGMAAHARKDDKDAPWSIEAHLAFCSVLFPLLVKVKLFNSGLLDLSPSDEYRLQTIDHYIGADPLSWLRRNRSPTEHPWAKIESDVDLAALQEYFVPVLSSKDSSAGD